VYDLIGSEIKAGTDKAE